MYTQITRTTWFLTNRYFGEISHTHAFMNRMSLQGRFDDNQLPNSFFIYYENCNAKPIVWKIVCKYTGTRYIVGIGILPQCVCYKL